MTNDNDLRTALTKLADELTDEMTPARDAWERGRWTAQRDLGITLRALLAAHPARPQAGSLAEYRDAAALNRATEELEETDLGFEHSRRQIRPIAHQVLSAALTDPDDPDWLAKVIFDRRDGDDIREWDDTTSDDREWFQCAAAAVRAAILGGAS